MSVGKIEYIMNQKVFINQKTLTVISTIVAVSVVFLLVGQNEHEVQSFVEDSVPKAVIIDQLNDEIPDEAFQKQATLYLEEAGYEVDLITTKEITVDFYKKLPTMNYKIVVVRTHGADDSDNSDVVLFTGEKYTEDKYISEQLFGNVKKAAPVLEIAFSPQNSNSEWVIVNDTYRYQKSSVKQEESTDDAYFAISPKFVKESMEGKFNDTLFILGGCETLVNPSLASSLVEKGASTVVGWDATVGNISNDSAILLFLENYLINQYDVKKTVSIIQDGLVPENMYYPANFIYYN